MISPSLAHSQKIIDDLQNLMDAITTKLPYMQGLMSHSDQTFVMDGQNARSKVNQLYSTFQQFHPEAGKVFWSTATWRTLIWPPIAVSLCAVHTFRCAPNLKSFTLRVTDHEILGYSLAPLPLFRGEESELIHYSAQQQTTLFASLFDDFNTVIKFQKKLADKLVSDMIAGTLMILKDVLDLNRKDVEDAFKLWLSAFKLPPVEATIRVTDDKLLLNRQSCCQSYRSATGERCEDCTKIPLAQRIKNLQDD